LFPLIPVCDFAHRVNMCYIIKSSLQETNKMPHPYFLEALDPSNDVDDDVTALYEAVQSLHEFLVQIGQEERIEEVFEEIGTLNHESNKTYDRSIAVRNLERFFLLMEIKALEIGKDQIPDYLSSVTYHAINSNRNFGYHYFGIYEDVRELWNWNTHSIIMTRLTRENLDLAITFLIKFAEFHKNFTYYSNFADAINNNIISEPSDPELPPKLHHDPVEIKAKILDLINSIPSELVTQYLNSRKYIGYQSIDSVLGEISLSSLDQDKFQKLLLDLIKASGRENNYLVPIDSEYLNEVRHDFCQILNQAQNNGQIMRWLTSQFEIAIIEVLTSDHMTEMGWYTYQVDVVRELIRPISHLLSDSFLGNLFGVIDSIDLEERTLMHVNQQAIFHKTNRNMPAMNLDDTRYGAISDLFSLVLDTWNGDVKPFYNSQAGSKYMTELMSSIIRTYKFNGSEWIFDIEEYNYPQMPRKALIGMFRGLDLEPIGRKFCKALIAATLYHSIDLDSDNQTYSFNYEAIVNSLIIGGCFRVPKVVQDLVCNIDTGYPLVNQFIIDLNRNLESRIIETPQLFNLIVQLWDQVLDDRNV
jgi:hypothetical protein